MQQGKLLHLLLTTLLFALGLFTRETTIALPVLFALSVLIFNPRRIGEPTKKKLIRTIITLAGYGIVLITYTLVQLIGRTGSLVERGGLVFHSLDPESILLGIMDYVHGLLPGGSYLASLPLDVLRLVVWLEAFILVAVAFTLWKTGQRLALFGLAWMLITPVIFVPFSVPTDRYFYLPHRGETRGIGGLFADDLNDIHAEIGGNFAHCFALIRRIGDAYLDTYVQIVKRRVGTEYGAREQEFQRLRRGRYVEFNLAFDRGTRFGLQSQARTESLLMSLPPRAEWRYDFRPEPGSPEACLAEYLKPRDWLGDA